MCRTRTIVFSKKLANSSKNPYHLRSKIPKLLCKETAQNSSSDSSPTLSPNNEKLQSTSFWSISQNSEISKLEHEIDELYDLYPGEINVNEDSTSIAELEEDIDSLVEQHSTQNINTEVKQNLPIQILPNTQNQAEANQILPIPNPEIEEDIIQILPNTQNQAEANQILPIPKPEIEGDIIHVPQILEDLSESESNQSEDSSQSEDFNQSQESIRSDLIIEQNMADQGDQNVPMQNNMIQSSMASHLNLHCSRST